MRSRASIIGRSAAALVVLATLYALPSAPATLAQSADAPVDPALFQALEYRLIGPHRAGRVTAVAGVRTQPFTFYMGYTGGGV